MLNPDQLREYESTGFFILRGAIPETDIQRLERGVANNPPLDGTLDPHAPVYPAPGRYTLANQCAKDPDLAFIIEHEAVLAPVKQILGPDPKLTAYVIYDRTPQGPGLPAHHDYKRWRPVGSSMNWLFTIIPFCDFDEARGPLFVAPGSHRLERVSHGDPCCEVEPAIKPNPDDFIDPELKRGDLLLMNMHLWHKASSNNSNEHRVGLFNKYAAANAPPATGYFLYEDSVAHALSEEGRNLIAVHSDKQLNLTRILLMRNPEHPEIYLSGTFNSHLPGGLVYDERAIPDWDLGNMIAPAQQHLREQVGIEVPWLSYIGDFTERQGLSRVYGYTLNDHGFPVAYDGQWVPVDQLDQQELEYPWIKQAIALWRDPSILRGKGLTQAASRIDQFAY